MQAPREVQPDASAVVHAVHDVAFAAAAHSAHMLLVVVEPVIQKEPSAQPAAVGYAQSAQVAPPVESVVPSHTTHVESVDALPAVQTDPSSQSVAVGSAQAVQASLLLAENVPALHSTHVVSAVVEPMVQKEPSAQSAAVGFDQAAQASLLPAENVPAVHSTHVVSAVVEPMVQKEPSAQSVAVGSDQAVQAVLHSVHVSALAALAHVASQPSGTSPFVLKWFASHTTAPSGQAAESAHPVHFPLATAGQVASQPLLKSESSLK